MSANPYAPTANSLVPEELPGDEALRRRYLKHEVSVKSVGLLYYLGAVALTLFGLVALPSVLLGDLPLGERIIVATVALFYLAIGTFQGFVGRGLRQLRPWAKICAIAFSVLGLLAFPLGTLINGYILYLLLSRKGATVFSEDYRRAIEATPHVKYKSPLWVLLLLAILVTLLIVGLLAAFIVA